MAVRPITKGEEMVAGGEPVATWLGIFGASQGLLTHLRMNGLQIGAKNLMPTPFAKATLPAFVIGGYVLGSTLGFQFFGDEQLRRLYLSHEKDKVLRTSARKYVPVEQL